ncbi:flagellar export chaperone FliS [Magnetospirillum sulfuroxidans]|uniref:Flagellar protein FliS n=1 Tax=Magnetospirillum sulfuroxidans TaxID=611300 RepID=A0ABS5IAJ5_9PROT|nr:flagellar export chaperone FliS [Magnetospirillum sulfuroxidans]MBR9971451.1 flagellar protein FliS [Magnetospirillum sulfuroxidans]
MNLSKHAIAAYQTAVMTTPPLQAVVLLYDGILVRLHNAANAAAAGDYGRQYDEIARANEILRGLLAALDLQAGGKLAAGLADTYRTNMQALLHTVGRKDAEKSCRRIAEGLRTLRNAWAEIAGMAMNEPKQSGFDA